ncbi:hypothetical protein [Streptomyces sp. HU2014]|nr:hypothetical protein [Streptomyces sp. HU2014]
MVRHRRPKPPFDWGRIKRGAAAAAPWAELLAAVTGLIWAMTGKN